MLYTTDLDMEQSKRTRRSASKVRTGCITCKIRRVKCDEAKPRCERCTKSGRKCDGYPPIKAPSSAWAVSAKKPLTLISAKPGIWTVGEDVQYLEFYHREAAQTLTGALDSTQFWTHSVLRIAQTEPSVRHAVIALGYLYRTETGSMKNARARLALEQQASTLIVHYNKAVHLLVARMRDASYSTEIGLVACLLFICIEMLRGNYAVAYNHLNNGLKIISETSHGMAKYSIDDTRDQVQSALGPSTSPRSNDIMEDVVLPLFGRSAASALMAGVHVERMFDIAIPSPQVFQDHRFSSIVDAQVSMQRLLLPSLYYVRTMAEKLAMNDTVSKKDLADQSQLLACLFSWQYSLMDLERHRTLSKEDLITSSALKAIYHGSFIALVTATEVLQDTIDRHLPSFKAIVRHARIVLDAGQPARSSSKPLLRSFDEQSSNKFRNAGANFTFEISLVPTLHHVTLRCRCPQTRREALRLLEKNPPREGYWDAEVHAKVARRVIELEEQKIDPESGWPREDSRLWCAIPDSNMDSKGGFWVMFAWGWWMQEQRKSGERFSVFGANFGRSDGQWREWFVL